MSNNLVKDNKCLIPMDFEGIKTEILKLAFPVGQSYVTQTNTNPSTILGFGTWERVKGRVLVGYDENNANFNEIGKVGGEETHTLTVSEMPSHTHIFTGTPHNHEQNLTKDGTQAGTGCYEFEPASGGNTVNKYTNNATAGGTNSNTGGGEAHNNLQPYKVVGYMWIRTA